jgi:hypothetical protein
MLDKHMRLELANSLEYIYQSILKDLNYSADVLVSMISKMRQGNMYPPSVFALYYEITSALIDEDYDQAILLLNELLDEKPYLNGEVEIITLNQVSNAASRLRFKKLMDTDSRTHFYIQSISDDSAAVSINRFRSTFKRLKESIPELAKEFEAIIRSVILVKGDEKMSYQFAGGSSYMLWGALFINADFYASDILMIEAIAHESAHSLLFGFSIDEGLVLNPDEELYSSPLREDPRPMDGIYHATFVSARMYWTMTALLASKKLAEDEALIATDANEINRINFFAGFISL